MSDTSSSLDIATAQEGIDPTRLKRACAVLDEVMDEPIDGPWENHLERCALAVLQAYRRDQ